jgi:murein DD-endopeptidase MepM/ murein hydrolase activator NlpD
VGERVVSWKVLADFAEIARTAKKAENALESLRRKQRQINAESATDTSGPSAKAAKAAEDAARATDKHTSATTRNVTAQQRQVAASRAADATARALARGHKAVADVLGETADQTIRSTRSTNQARDSMGRFTRETERTTRSTNQARDSMGRFARSTDDVGRSSERSSGWLGRLSRSLQDLQKQWGGNSRGAMRFGSALRLAAIPLIITGINSLIAVLSPLAAGFMGLVGAIAPVTGLLATLPGLLTAAVGGAGTLIAGFAGIGGALKAYGKQQEESSKAAKTAATDRAKEVRNIRNAQENLQDAYTRSKESAVASARAVSGAEENLRDAQMRARFAQEDLTRARKDARDQLEDLKRSVRDLALSEEDASLSLEEARNRLREVNRDPGATSLEKRRADLAVREAMARLDNVREAQRDADEELKDANKRGVEGSREVIAAREAERDAAQGVIDAQRALRDAQRDSRRSARDSARAIRDAREALDDARVSAKKATPALDEFNDAMAKLTPEARAVVKQMISMKPQIDKIRATAQRGMLPGFLDLLQDLEAVFPTVNRFVGRAAETFGDFFRRVGAGLSSPTGIRSLETILASSARVIDSWADSAYNIGVTLGNIAVAAAPLTEWLVNGFEGWTNYWRAATSGAEGQERLREFFIKTRETVELLGEIIGNLAGTLFNIGSATADTGRWMLESFKEITEGWEEFTGSVEGQNAIKEWADRARPVLSGIGELIGTLITGLADLGEKIDLESLITQINDELVPALLDLMAVFTGDIAEDIISIVTNVARFIAAFGPEGSNALGVFVDLLEKLSGWMVFLVEEVPGATTVISLFLLAFAASKIAGLLATVTGVKALSGAITNLGKKGAAPGSAAAGGGLAAFWVGLGRLKDALGKVVPFLLGLGAAFLRILPWIGRVALVVVRFVPVIGWIVTALAIAIPLIIKHWDIIKKVFLMSLDVIVGFISMSVERMRAFWGRVVEIFGPPITRALEFVLERFRYFIAAVSVILKIIGTVFKIGWELLYHLIIQPIWRGIQWVIEQFGRFGRWLVYTARLVGLLFKAGWDLFKEYTIRPLREGIAWVRDQFARFGRWIADQARRFVAWVKTHWDKFKKNLPQPIQDALTEMGKLWTKIKSGFSDMVTKVKEALAPLGGFVKEAFDKIKKAASDPIQIVVDIVNGGLIRPYRRLAEKLGIETTVEEIVWAPPKADGGPIESRAGGGKIRGRGGPRQDNIAGIDRRTRRQTSWVSAGEFVVNERAYRKNKRLVEAINASGRMHGPLHPLRRADGGPIPRLFLGGTLPTTAARISRHTSGYPWARWSGDINGPGDDFGQMIRAWKAGQVSATNNWNYSYGKHIKINHGKERTLYAHLSRIGVNVGQRVGAGQVIGNLGSTGNSSGPHLHFELSGGTGQLVGAVLSKLNNAGQSLWDKVNPRNVLDGLLDKIRGPVDKVRGTMFGDLAAAVPGKIKSWMLSFLDKNAGDAKQTDPVSGSANGDGRLGPRAAAFRQWVLDNVGNFTIYGYANRNIAGTNKLSKHALGKAIDVMTFNAATHRRIANEAVSNARRWGTDNVITRGRIWNRRGWHAGRGSAAGHFDHIHVDFHKDGGRVRPGRVKGRYGRGTNSTRQGPILVGENGPEVMYSRGGDRIVNNSLTRMFGYHSGGSVGGGLAYGGFTPAGVDLPSFSASPVRVPTRGVTRPVMGIEDLAKVIERKGNHVTIYLDGTKMFDELLDSDREFHASLERMTR